MLLDMIRMAILRPALMAMLVSACASPTQPETPCSIPAGDLALRLTLLQQPRDRPVARELVRLTAGAAICDRITNAQGEAVWYVPAGAYTVRIGVWDYPFDVSSDMQWELSLPESR